MMNIRSAFLAVLLTTVIGSGAVRAQSGDTGSVSDADGQRDCSKLIASGNPDYPPYLWVSKDGQTLHGAAAEFIKTVGARAGVEIEVINSGSWGRVQQHMREGTIDLIAGAFLTVPRLSYMDYFHPAFQGTRTLIWTRDNLDLRYSTWSDLVGIEGLTVINNSFGQAFDDYARQNLTIREVPSLEQGLQMLSLDRAEYLIYEEFPGKAVIAHENITNLRSYDTPVSSEDLYITMSHQSECNTGELRGRLSEAVFELVSQGLMTQMLEASIQEWGETTN
ncbi:transporter substrate-binding domain-containing protein [Thalassospira sp.]|uniref:substrate-binding periplasmic protein n=1 Tax=Thalassospira sp. TaxID=1912094 RepID=UPI000C52908F|nr:transporter substrate-binding domain-containing protein [Thalassospira sp.]MBC06799.1 ABC transporter substrate-binding protein [Thalassospira sp.]|tara:strand:+ start:824 stop:1657 length:834 start_codon:yes stop_codon:yes gene_type:complete